MIKKLQSRFTSVLYILLIFHLFYQPGALLALGTKSGDSTQWPHFVEGTVALSTDQMDAVRQALIASADQLPDSEHYAVSAMTKLDGSWIFVSVTGLRGLGSDLKWNLTDHSNWYGLVLLHQSEAKQWISALDGSKAYASLLRLVPGRLLDNASTKWPRPTAYCRGRQNHTSSHGSLTRLCTMVSKAFTTMGTTALPLGGWR